MRQVILDTDTGVDDALAIAFLARSPEIELKAAVATFGNNHTNHTVVNAGYVLDCYGLNDVPVYAGATEPIVRDYHPGAVIVHGPTGLGYHDATDTHGTKPGWGPSAMLRHLRESSEPVTILAIGPLTNVALALLEDQSAMSEKVERIVLMGGSASRGNVTPAAEANFYTDPEAAGRVMKSGIPITMVGLDVTEKMAVSSRFIDRLEASSVLNADWLTKALRFYAGFNREKSGFDGFVFHDPLAAAVLVNPEICKTRPAHVEIVLASDMTQGQSLCEFTEQFGEFNGDVAMEVDAAAAIEFILGRIAPGISVDVEEAPASASGLAA